MARQRCSSIARELDEPLYGTAPVSGAWVLLEHPLPWGRDALTESWLDPEVSEELSRRSKDHGFKILFIRRPADRTPGAPRCCFLVRSAPGQSWMERLQVAGPEDLLEVEPSALQRPGPPGLGESVSHLWAVCTHGRRDLCCAEFGVKLIRALLQTDPSWRAGLWESSHQGGHRFAPNLALFPHGLFYGEVDPAGAPRILESYRDRRLALDGYRGRSAFDTVTQAADYMVRREAGITGIDDLVPTGRRELGGERYSVGFNGVLGALTLTLEVSEGPMRPESCSKPELTPVKLYRRLDLTPGLAESPTV